MIRYFSVLRNGRVEVKSEANAANWIHLENPSDTEIQKMVSRYKIPSDYLLSTLDPDEVSRGEEIRQTEIVKPVLLSLLYPMETSDREGQGVYETRTISIIITAEILLTCVKQNPVFLDKIFDGHFDLVKEAANERGLAIELAWQISRAYVFAIRDINARIDSIHKCLRQSTKSETLLQLAELDKSVVYLSTAIEENHPLIFALSESAYLANSDLRKEWLHDVLVENHQAEKMISQSRQMLVQLDTTFSSIIQNNLNEIMKVLTSITILITIPTVTAGFYGMNVGLPFMNHPLAFWGLIVVTVLLCVICALWLKRRNML